MSKTTVRRLPPAERRAAISASARAIALADGLSAITLRAVAAHAGMSPALVAHYTTSMEDLVVQTFVDIVHDQLQEYQLWVASGPAVLKLSRFLQSLFTGEHEVSATIWAESWALGRRSEAFAREVRAENDRWLQFLESMIEAGREEGTISVRSVSDAAMQLLSIFDGTNVHTLVGWKAGPERLLVIEQAVEAMLGMEPGIFAQTRAAQGEGALPHDRAASAAASRHPDLGAAAGNKDFEIEED